MTVKTGSYSNNDGTTTITVYPLDDDGKNFDIFYMDNEDEWMGSYTASELKTLIQESDATWKRELTKEEMEF